MSHAEAEIRRRGAVPDEIEDAGPQGELARREVGRLAYEINVQQYACAGLNFGTYYDRSPIIAYDGSEHPAYTMDSYTPSTVPGCRTPHLWCEDGSSLYDAMGPEFTLLRFDPARRRRGARDRGAQQGRAAEGSRHRTAKATAKRLSMAAGWCCRGRTSMWPGAAIARRPIRLR